LPAKRNICSNPACTNLNLKKVSATATSSGRYSNTISMRLPANSIPALCTHRQNGLGSPTASQRKSKLSAVGLMMWKRKVFRVRNPVLSTSTTLRSAHSIGDGMPCSFFRLPARRDR